MTDGNPKRHVAAPAPEDLAWYASPGNSLTHGPATDQDLRELSALWRPLRTRPCVLLRVAGERARFPPRGTANLTDSRLTRGAVSPVAEVLAVHQSEMSSAEIRLVSNGVEAIDASFDDPLTRRLSPALLR
jgi:hypothetical protein